MEIGQCGPASSPEEVLLLPVMLTGDWEIFGRRYKLNFLISVLVSCSLLLCPSVPCGALPLVVQLPTLRTAQHAVLYELAAD